MRLASSSRASFSVVVVRNSMLCAWASMALVLAGRLRAKIGEHAAAQDARLAHIDDLAFAVPVQIDTGRERDGRRIGFLHGPMLQAGAGRASHGRMGEQGASPLPIKILPTDS